ncbi:MAG TPA: RNA 3'-terminal phosphate cyclase, partial [bacterium]|nr:RNA 3'-terminal phosphate cyclase [bacterium]
MRNTAEIFPVMLEIDGGQKSGSGTIVRDVVSLASLTGQEVHLRNIRAKRRSPGLRPQHVTAVKAISELCDGEVHGAEV